MGRRGSRQRTTHRTKAETLEVKPPIKEKFLQERIAKPVVPMNQRQAEYIQAIKTKQLIIATGYAGSSKTFIATCMAADAFRTGQISKIYLSRPNISNSQSLGFFSGSVIEKMSCWMMPVLSVLYQRMGRAATTIALENKDIEFVPLETIKGMSFGEDCWVIIDEAEDLTIEEVKCVATRVGGAKCILSGDTAQSALYDNSGLAIFEDMVLDNPKLQEHIGHICFDEYAHIVRSKLCKELIIAFDKEGY